MLIEFIPVMLFILGWNPEGPEDFDLQRQPVLFASIAECEEEGAKIAERLATEGSGMRFEARCVEFPDRSEMDELLKREFRQTERPQ